MIETILINTNFVVLFTLTLFYWLNVLNFFPFLMGLCTIGIKFSQFLQLAFLCLRFITSGHFPLSNLYESLLFLSWLLTFLLLNLSSITTKMEQSQSKQLNFQQVVSSSIIGAVMSPVILLVNTFALFSLPIELKQTTALVPALQSNWLLMHVTVMILSYATLIAGALFSMAFLVLTFFQMKLTSNWNVQAVNESLELSSEPNLTMDFPTLNETSKKPLSIANFLDSISYRLIGFGFMFLTIGLLSGSIWANQTWGSYWSWDPKETWALITWFIFAIYLHTRLSRGWYGRKAALLATFGFFVLWICYLGVNLMGKGLHSYGFLS